MFPLPSGWSTPDAVADAIDLDGVEVHRAGVSAVGPTGEEMCGSAADRLGPAPDRAWFELVERVCIIDALAAQQAGYSLLDAGGHEAGMISSSDLFPESDAPDRWVYARSSGVAIHQDWETACRHAHWELADRDRILRSWRGELAPRPLALDVPATTHYEWLAASFDAVPGSFSDGIEVAAVCAIPRDETLPFAIGFAARDSVAAARDTATREAIQQLAFLWGEASPSAVPVQKPSAGLHLDTYQVPTNRARIKAWLTSGHAGVRGEAASESGVAFVDLGSGWLPNSLRVAKAVAKGALPLTFGDAPFVQALPSALRIHPIS